MRTQGRRVSGPARGTDRVTHRVRAAIDAISCGGGVCFVAALWSANAGNAAFHLIASRQLGPATYGAVGALLTILLTLSVPAGAVQVAMARQFARRRGDADNTNIRPALKRSALVAAFLAAAVVITSPLLSAYLHLASPVPVLLLALWVVAAVVGLVPCALLIGESRWRPAARAVVAGTLTRLVFGLVLLRTGGGVAAAMGATIAGEVAQTVMFLAAARRALRGQGPALTLRYREVADSVLAFAGLWVLIGIDTVIARHYLTEGASGSYAVAAVATRAALFFPAAIAVVLFPRFTQSVRDARRDLAAALVFAAVSGGAATAALLVAGGDVVQSLVGSTYEFSTSLLGLLALGAVCTALLYVLTYFHLAHGSSRAQSSWLGVVVFLAAAMSWHSSAEAIAVFSVAATALALAVAARGTLGARSSEEREVPAYDTDSALAVPASLDLTVVVPFYNPGLALRPLVVGLVEALRATGLTFEVIAVSDGSRDGSEATIADFDPAEVRCLVLARNRGKGRSLRAGLHEGRGQYLGFIDGDGDIDPRGWARFIDLMKSGEPAFVIGSKRHPESTVTYPLARRIMSRAYLVLVHALVGLRLTDTQTGMKLARRDVLALVLPHTIEQGFAFDVEVLAVARRLGYDHVVEAPVHVSHASHSTISAKAMWRMLLDTLSVARRLKVDATRSAEVTHPPRSRPSPRVAERAPVGMAG